MAPPLLPPHYTPLGYAQEPSQVEKTAHQADPTLFYDPRFRRDVSDYMHHSKTVPYKRPAKFSAPYNPADDDLLVWKQRLAGQNSSAYAGIKGNKGKQDPGLEEQGSKGDERRVTEINDMGNDITLGGKFGGKVLGYLPLANWQEGPSGVHKEMEKQ
jgi:hypothetical protein